VVAEPTKSLTLLRAPLAPEISFDQKQQEIIAHRGSPLIVLGGPGTGKSATLVARAKSYISSGVNPNKILVITFDRHRATELNDEIFAQFRETTEGSLVKTFPALAFAILRLYRAKSGAKPPRLRTGAEQDYLIRELLAGSYEKNPHGWPEHLRQASQTRAFATQLRDLISRTIEQGISDEELAALGKAQNFPLWKSAASFMREYTQVSGLEQENAYDPSEMVFQATRALKEDPVFREDIRTRHEVILVDEFQESDQSHRHLLSLLYRDELTVFLDPDSAVGRFRGADPESLPDIFDLYCSADKSPAQKKILNHDYRATQALNTLTNQIASGFTFSRVIEHRKRTCERVTIGDAQALQIAQCESVHDEARFIAEKFQQLHLRDGVPYGEMAVIIRSPSTRATTLRRVFASMNIPVREEIQSLPLISQPAVAPLISLATLAFALSRGTVTPEKVEELLPNQLIDELFLSRYGGADFLTLKRMRATLINAREEGDTRTSYQILRDNLVFSLSELDWNEFAPVKRIAELINAGKKSARPGATSEDVLWAIWASATDEFGTPLAQSWQRDAIAGDENADRDLDGVLALFEAAARYADQRPGNSGDSFIRQLSHESIASDTIAAKAQRRDVVSILTTHAAKGRQWSVVAVAGLEEGIWPNLTPRGSLLGSERLVETLRSTSANNRTAREFQLAALSALKDDERRLFYNAISRARDYLIVSATAAEESRPSQFFNEIVEILGLDQSEISSQSGSSYLTPSRLVAKLRSIAEREIDSELGRAAISVLAYLHRSGVRVANPETWYGARELTTNEPLFTEAEPIKISPSSLETLHKCPLKWAFEYAGGRDSDSSAQIIGTSFHAIAAKLKDGATLTQLREELTLLWDQLANRMEIGSGWVAKTQLQRALVMLENLVAHQEASGRTLIGVEERFTVQVGKVTISGSVDRLEITENDELFVVDLKTGKNPISVKDGHEHPQLKLYQLAITEGKFNELSPSTISAGAELLYPASGPKWSKSLRSQPKIDAGEVREMVIKDGETVSAQTFVATENDLCRNCNFISSCPVQPEGRSLR